MKHGHLQIWHFASCASETYRTIKGAINYVCMVILALLIQCITCMHHVFNESKWNFKYHVDSFPMTYSMKHGLFVCGKYFGAIWNDLSAVPLSIDCPWGKDILTGFHKQNCEEEILVKKMQRVGFVPPAPLQQIMFQSDLWSLVVLH